MGPHRGEGNALTSSKFFTVESRDGYELDGYLKVELSVYSDDSREGMTTIVLEPHEAVELAVNLIQSAESCRRRIEENR